MLTFTLIWHRGGADTLSERPIVLSSMLPGQPIAIDTNISIHKA